MVDVQDCLVPALPALHIERAHAVGPHVGEVHRLDRITRPGASHRWRSDVCQIGLNLALIMPRNFSEGEIVRADDMRVRCTRRHVLSSTRASDGPQPRTSLGVGVSNGFHPRVAYWQPNVRADRISVRREVWGWIRNDRGGIFRPCLFFTMRRLPPPLPVPHHRRAVQVLDLARECDPEGISHLLRSSALTQYIFWPLSLRARATPSKLKRCNRPETSPSTKPRTNIAVAVAPDASPI
jgi:hypothetical protein